MHILAEENVSTDYLSKNFQVCTMNVPSNITPFTTETLKETQEADKESNKLYQKNKLILNQENKLYQDNDGRVFIPARLHTQFCT